MAILTFFLSRVYRFYLLAFIQNKSSEWNRKSVHAMMNYTSTQTYISL